MALPSQRLIHPSTIMISGPTGCGKTQYLLRLLKERMFTVHSFDCVFVIYSDMQPAYKELQLLYPNIQMSKKFSEELYNSISPNKNNLLILDDVKLAVGNSELLEHLFTVGSHHRRITTIYIVHNLFTKTNMHRQISLNTQYFLIFRQPRDRQQVQRFASQMFGSDGWRTFLKVYDMVTSKPHRALLVDMRNETHELFRLRSYIWPKHVGGEVKAAVYIRSGDVDNPSVVEHMVRLSDQQ